jgi:hypothetical protein
MRKIFFAFVCLASMTMFVACNQNKPTNGNENNETNGEELTEQVIVANLPVNVKFTTNIVEDQPGTSYTEINATVTKIGADWVLKGTGAKTVFLLDNETKTENEDITVYVRFDKDGKALKQFTSGDGGQTWTETTKYSKFSTFAFINANKPFLDPSVNMGYGCQLDKVYTKTEEKGEVIGRPCTKYTKTTTVDTNGNGNYMTTTSVLLVDDATHLVFREDFSKEGFTRTSVVTAWDESVKAFDVVLPQ